jgi:hypothetical protein
MRPGALRRVGLSVAPPLMFGVVFAAVKGEGAGVREAVGNLGAFYATESALLHLGGHSWVTNMHLTLHAGRMYFAPGIVTGLAFGALGGAARRYGPLWALPALLLLAFEPLALDQYGLDRGAGDPLRNPLGVGR